MLEWHGAPGLGEAVEPTFLPFVLLLLTLYLFVLKWITTSIGESLEAK